MEWMKLVKLANDTGAAGS